MRDCQICGAVSAKCIVPFYAGSLYRLYECGICGHRYVDSPALSQSALDRYYLEVYKTDDKPYSNERLNSLAACVASRSMRVLDIGGTDGELQSRVNRIGTICDVVGVEITETGRYDGVILSHTLEHIYDLKAMLDRVKTNLVDDGYLFIEVPIHSNPYLAPEEYDYHYQHINKFRVIDLERLVRENGFDVLVSEPLPDYREYHCHRLIGQKA